VTRDQLVWYGVSALLAAIGMLLMLPRGRVAGRSVRVAGAIFALAGLVGFAWKLPQITPLLDAGLFWILAAVTIMSAAATVTFRSPVYCAIWFAMTLLGTSGLMFFQGAQFLGIATMVVYAGAILVTFLFVLMLAQPEGHAYYDRVSWEAPISTIAGAIMVAILTMTIANTVSGVRTQAAASTTTPAATTAPATGARAETPGLAAQVANEPPVVAQSEKLPPPEFHMAQLGAELFGGHLIAVEVAGTLLLAALVGAAAIVAQSKQAVTPGSGRSHG
jgi:NADH-quinone oxidoreductase subunit J